MRHKLPTSGTIKFGFDSEVNELVMMMGDTVIRTNDTYQFENKEIPFVYYLQSLIQLDERGKKDEHLCAEIQRFCAQTEEGKKMVAKCDDVNRRAYLRTEKGYQESLDEVDRKHPEISSAAIMAGATTEEDLRKVFNQTDEEYKEEMDFSWGLMEELGAKFPRNQRGQVILSGAIAVVRDYCAKEKDDKRWQYAQGILRGLVKRQKTTWN